MSTKNISNVVSVIPVHAYEAAVAWYTKLFKRDPDLIPMEGISEWELAENAWVQVTKDSERSGSTTVVVGVHCLESQHKECLESELPIAEIIEYPNLVKLADIIDPEGNKITFVEDISCKMN